MKEMTFYEMTVLESRPYRNKLVSNHGSGHHKILQSTFLFQILEQKTNRRRNNTINWLWLYTECTNNADCKISS